MGMVRTKIFVEAVPLVDTQTSGVPHALANIVAALAAHPTIQEKFTIVLVAPRNRMHLLDRWPGLGTCERKAIPMKFRIMNGLGRRGLLPPMDLFLGRGIYLFGNFFNWPLTSNSVSFTYIHDICFVTHPELVQPDNQRMLSKNVPRFIRQSSYILTVSQHARHEIIEYFHVSPERVVVVHNAADPNLFHAYSEPEVRAVKTKYGLKEDQKYFLFVGNIEPRKNLERMLKAYMELPREHALLLVGSDGWLNEKIFVLIEEANRQGYTVIKPRTYVPDEDVAKLVSGASALLKPSLYEGFGMPPLEAMTAGTPVVVSDIPPLREVVGTAGVYCDPLRVDSIAEAMRQITDLTLEERRTLVRQGRAQAAQFSWDRSAAVLVDKFLEITSSQ